MVMLESDKARKNLKYLLKALYIWFIVVNAKHRGVKVFMFNFYLWCLYKMQLGKLKVIRVPFKYHSEKVYECTENCDDFIGDPKTCALIGDDTFNLFGRKQWLCLKADGQQLVSTAQPIQCLVHKDVPAGSILLKEDLFFNLAKLFNLDSLADSFDCFAYPAASSYIADLASSIKVSLTLSPTEWNSEDEADVLDSYFWRPRYLHVGDVFSVPLEEFAIHLHKSGKYHNVLELHFKVQELQSHCKDWHPAEGLYVVKDHCDLYSCTPVASFLPPKTEKFNFRNNFECISAITPPDLTKYTSQLSTFMKPFLKNQEQLKIQPMFLLTGGQGSGKMAVLKAVSQNFGVHLMVVDCYEFHGVGVQAVEAKFDFIFAKAAKIGPCILTFTNLELLGKDRVNKEDARVVNSFLQHAMAAVQSSATFPLVFVGVTNQKTDSLLPSLHRAFLQTVQFEAPKPDEAVSTIAWLARDKGYDINEQTLETLSSKITGYVHADLVLLVRHAIRIMAEDSDCQLLLDHFERGIELMEAAYSDTIGAAKVPSVHWDDVGGLSALKEEVSLTLSLPQQKPGLLSGALRRSGILFYGPPGTGKTLMAKAVATECAMNFLSVKGPELMNMYVGQSERNVREVFERAREAAPCILFFDELDSLAPNRGKSGDGGGVTDRVVSQLLSEMDGLQTNRGLFVIAATNRPDLVDPALLRPGRFDKMFYLGPCVEVDAKLSVLQALTKKFTISDDVDLSSIASKLPSHVTGADVYSVCSNAWLSAARRNILQIQEGVTVSLPFPVMADDFDRGIADLVPSLTADDLTYYENLSSSTIGK